VQRPRAANALDWLTLVLVSVAVAIAVTGGISGRLGGIRVTARSPERALVAAVALIVLRVAIDRRTRPFAGVSQILPLLYRPAADAVVTDSVAPEPRSEWRSRLIALLGLCAFAAYLLYPQLRRMEFVPDLGDPLFSIWRIGWVYHKLGGDPRPLFSPNIFYPHSLTLTYSDSMLLPALTTAPFLALGVHPVVAYNWVMILSFIASAFAMYLLAERLTGSRTAAFVAGLLFGFYPYRFEHYSHFELQMTYCMPLALLALHRFVNTSRTRDAVAFGVLAAGQLYSSMYYAVFFSVYVAAVLLLWCLLARPPLKRMLGPAAIAGGLALLLALPLARTYSSAHLGDRDVDTVKFYSATGADYLRAHPRSATWGSRMLAGRMPERALFPGVMILLLAAVALVPPLGVTRLVYAGALLVAFQMSRGFNGSFYPYLYEYLPFIRGLRVPARASILVGLTLALLAGFGVRRLLQGRSLWLERGALAALVVMIAVDLQPVLQLDRVWPAPPSIYGRVSGARDVVLAEFPFGGVSRRFTPNAPFMYFSLWHWASMINGYSGHSPPGQGEFEATLSSFPDAAAVESLRARGATHVTINCALYGGGCEQLVATVDELPAFRVLASDRWLGSSVRLYELTGR
jgi:hypothetical protein